MPRTTPAPAPRRGPEPAAHTEGTVRFSTQNWLLLAAALAAIVAGYVTLSAGSTVAAPLLLVLGYAVLLPLGIIR